MPDTRPLSNEVASAFAKAVSDNGTATIRVPSYFKKKAKEVITDPVPPRVVEVPEVEKDVTFEVKKEAEPEVKKDVTPEVTREAGSGEWYENVPVNIKNKLLLFVRVVPSMDSVSLETAITLAATGHSVVFVYDPNSNYDDFFRLNKDTDRYELVKPGSLTAETIANLTIVPSNKFNQIKLSQNVDFVVCDTTEVILKENPDFVILDMTQDPFVLRNFERRNRNHIKNTKVVYLFSNYIPGFGVSEKNVIKTMDHSGYVLRMEDKNGLNNTAFVDKMSSLAKKKNEQAVEYMAPMYRFLSRE